METTKNTSTADTADTADTAAAAMRSTVAGEAAAARQRLDIDGRRHHASKAVGRSPDVDAGTHRRVRARPR